MAALSDNDISAVLTDTATVLKNHIEEILEANRKDLSRMDPSNPKYDRLTLTEARLNGMAEDMAKVAQLPSPRNRLLNETVRPNGLIIRKVSVPFGVIGIIYEARPNVTTDVYSLCLRSGNVCILKGGSDADSSIRAIVRIIHTVLNNRGLNPAICTLLPQGHESTAALLEADKFVDLIIPRGSSSLIQFVRQNAHAVGQRLDVVQYSGAGSCEPRHRFKKSIGDRWNLPA